MRYLGSRVEAMVIVRVMAWRGGLCVCARTPLVPPGRA